MPGDEVIELSVEETNALRAKLGMAPLRGVAGGRADASSTEERSRSHNDAASDVDTNQEELSLSVNDTNALRAKLGLAPLRQQETTEESSGTSAYKAIHAPATNLAEQRKAKERIEKATLQRQVQDNLSKLAASKGLGEEDENDALEWARKMRAKKQEPKKTKTQKKKPATTAATATDAYDTADLEGMTVSHNVGELESGKTTILTLQDTSILEMDDASKKPIGLADAAATLENVDLREESTARDNLRKKRQVEMAMGRSGGYAGYDDEEFEELGGIGAPPSSWAGGDSNYESRKNKKKTNKRGFVIGQYKDKEEEGLPQKSDLFATRVSLEPSSEDVVVVASDFMTVNEDVVVSSKQNKKKKKKDKKFKKVKKKKDKHLRRELEDDDDEPASAAGGGNLLEELQSTAAEQHHHRGGAQHRRKRRRDDDDDDEEEETDNGHARREATHDNTSKAEEEEDDSRVLQRKRARYDQIMEKGNVKKVDGKSQTTEQKLPPPKPPVVPQEEEEEADDAFLNAALAKTRRLRKLKEMQQNEKKGAEAVAQAVQSQSKFMEQHTHQEQQETFGGGVEFEFDETREFTRALRARAEQVERVKARKQEPIKEKVAEQPSVNQELKESDKMAEEEMTEDVDIEELAEQIEEPQEGRGLDGTANSVGVGRGLSNVLSMLRHTGEITGKNAGKEELRGRAKDERNYEDYQPLDLKEVVKIDESRATEKDLEFANRQIKLEYRDEHGRLVTTKEAWRNLCYQFHGFSSGKKNEERRLRKIQQERAEQALASRQGAGAAAGTLGALKATQKATGKAFVVHKTT